MSTRLGFKSLLFVLFETKIMDKVESKIKNFFRRKKTQAQFKVYLNGAVVYLIKRLFLQSAGPGRKLTDGPSSSSSSSKPTKRDDVYVPPKRNELSAEAR